MNILLVNANSLSIPLADKSVDMVMTSVPYWAQRDYGEENQFGLEALPDCLGWATGHPCGSCFICHLVRAFREVRRVLKSNGSAWVNIDDTYSNAGKNGGHSYGKNYTSAAGGYQTARNMKKIFKKIKPKDLVGIPFRFALAMQADGWYYRVDNIWNKTNAMPEPVKDRPTRSHEYVFLFSKSSRYYCDMSEIKEPVAASTIGRGPVEFGGKKGREYNPEPGDPNFRNGSEQWGRTFDYLESCEDGRNKRTVWDLSTVSYPGLHYAAYPPALVEICIKAGCPEGGIVLDPFVGSGTTLQVARALGRNAIGLDLSMVYLQNEARERLSLNALEAWTDGIRVENPDGYHDLPLFDQPAAAD